MVLPALASIGLGLGSGFAFGTGYGAGVRFGYEDVYPYLKSNMSEIAKMLNIPFASSGFKLASGVTEKQGALVGVDSIVKQHQLSTPESMTPQVSPSGQRAITVVSERPRLSPQGSEPRTVWEDLGNSYYKRWEYDTHQKFWKPNGELVRGKSIGL